MNISIVVPLSSSESTYGNLLSNLNALEFEGEVVLVSPNSSNHTIPACTSYKFNLVHLSGGNSRSTQMNIGALNTTNEFIWFLHADSILPSDALHRINLIIARNIESIHYFYISFYSKHYVPVFLNSIGANLRSLLFRAPFGDQGFIMRKETFFRLGQYEENLEYGEDNVFILKAKNSRIPILPIGATISTSARKYEDKGWLRTTLMHQFLWIKQSLHTIYKGYEE